MTSSADCDLINRLDKLDRRMTVLLWQFAVLMGLEFILLAATVLLPLHH